MKKLEDINSPLYEYIGNEDCIPGNDLRVKRRIIRTFLNLVVRLTSQSDITPTIFQFTFRNLINRINQSRTSSGTEQFYNLPVVQICARGISRLSVDSKILSVKDLWPVANRAMIEIISAFYRGSGIASKICKISGENVHGYAFTGVCVVERRSNRTILSNFGLTGQFFKNDRLNTTLKTLRLQFFKLFRAFFGPLKKSV